MLLREDSDEGISSDPGKVISTPFSFRQPDKLLPGKRLLSLKIPHYPVHKSDLYARSNMRRKRRRSSSFSPQSPTRSLKKDGEQSSERDAVLTNSCRKFHSVFKMATTFYDTEISGGEFFLDKTGCFYSKQF